MSLNRKLYTRFCYPCIGIVYFSSKPMSLTHWGSAPDPEIHLALPPFTAWGALLPDPARNSIKQLSEYRSICFLLM